MNLERRFCKVFCSYNRKSYVEKRNENVFAVALIARFPTTPPACKWDVYRTLARIQATMTELQLHVSTYDFCKTGRIPWFWWFDLALATFTNASLEVLRWSRCVAESIRQVTAANIMSRHYVGTSAQKLSKTPVASNLL